MDLPLFPLPTVLYPGAHLPLHVFEERYRLMFARVLAGPRRFGVVAIVEAPQVLQSVGGPSPYQPVGCVAEVRDVRRYPDGRLDVVAAGRERFQVERLVQSAPFVVAEVAALTEVAGDAAEGRLAAACEQYARYLAALTAATGDPPPEVTAPATAHHPGGTTLSLPGGRTVAVPADPIAASYLLAGSLRVDLPEKQRLLAAATAAERLRTATRLFRREVALLEHGRVMGPARMNGPFSLN